MAFLSPSADAVSVAEATGSQLQTSISGHKKLMVMLHRFNRHTVDWQSQFT